MVPLGKLRGESSGNNFLRYHIASKSMEFLAESWLLPQEDMSLMLGGDAEVQEDTDLDGAGDAPTPHGGLG